MNRNEDCATTGPCQDQCNQRATPRDGAFEFAGVSRARYANRVDEAFEGEIIRAREIGQREGKEDEQVAHRIYVRSLEIQLKNALEMARQKPAPVFIVDSRVPDLQQQLKDALMKNAGLQELNDNQANFINYYQTENAKLEERNGWQARQLETCSASMRESHLLREEMAKRLEGMEWKLREVAQQLKRG